MSNCICIIVSTDGRLVGMNLIFAGLFAAPGQAKLGLTPPNLGLAQAE